MVEHHAAGTMELRPHLRAVELKRWARASKHADPKESRHWLTLWHLHPSRMLRRGRGLPAALHQRFRAPENWRHRVVHGAGYLYPSHERCAQGVRPRHEGWHKRRVLLLLNQTGWHVAKDLVLPTGILLWYLLAYTPELSPAGHLRPHPMRGTANCFFPQLDDLAEVLAARCRQLTQDPASAQGATRFHRWSKRG